MGSQATAGKKAMREQERDSLIRAHTGLARNLALRLAGRVAAMQGRARMRQSVARLSEREQTILSLYYQEELTYREIGEVLGVTESRICQILRGIHCRLREELQETA